MRDRTRIVLMAADGQSSRAIAQDIPCTPGTASKWRVRTGGRIVRDGVLLHRYSKTDARDASRCRAVLPLSVRRTRSSRQAITCAWVTVRNSAGRRPPVNHIQSRTAFS